MALCTIERSCPFCRRRIVVENGRFTQHIDPATWDPIVRKFQACPGVGKLVRALQTKEQIHDR